jgi:putative tryptophan/tyrosine transport system substrate-binding protein
MRRRDFIVGLVGAAAWPLAARAQQPAMPVVGVLTVGSSTNPVLPPQFLQGLRETGYIEGRNFTIEYRGAEGRYDRLPALAADLVARRVAVIAAGPSQAALAAKNATTTIPIVFSIGADPVEDGLVVRLNRPGGNVKGASSFTVGLTAKRLRILLEVVPKSTIVALLVNPTSPNAEYERMVVMAAAATLGRKVEVFGASTENGIDEVFAMLVENGVGALVLGNDGFFALRREQIAALATRHSIATIYPLRAYATDGGLMSYGTNPGDAYHVQGNYVGRILKGEKPADLPVQLPVKFELIVNLKSAKAIGLAIPETFLVRADEVIE